ncbi:MAG: methyltransferase domain-containing protein [Actinomycetota bacterium]
MVAGDRYTHGHHESVIRSHRWRTAENSAGYLLPHLRAGQDLLDVGCGPGQITLGLAERVAPCRVIGIDRDAGIVEQARNLVARNVEFQTDDAYELSFDDATFDVVHAHQVLQHLTDPVRALHEWRRVLRPGGLLAVRDSDYGAFTWGPVDPMLDRWLELYHQVTERNGAEADAGRHLLSWVRQAGFTDTLCTSSTWTFADDATREWWGGSWADRVRYSSFAQQAVDYGLSETSELEAIARAFLRWSTAADGVFVVVHVEVMAYR